MDTGLNLVILLAMVIWIGSIVFFSFIVAPILFRVLSPADAGKVVRAVFPRYYLVGIVCGLMALSSFISLALWHVGWSQIMTVQLGLLGIMVVINLYARQSLTPRINAARDAGDTEKDRFDRLHRQSVILNGVVLLLGLAVLFLIAQGMA